jgi:hypothetical protein
MRDLRLIGVHEDGQHLLLSDADGERFRVALDEPLRAAARRDRPHLGQLQIEIDGGMRPREVQALIRAGLSAQDVSDRSGWAVEKVRRFEGPILAEREYVAGLARAVRLRGRSGGGATAPTLSARVSQRLSGRGVDPATAEWDSARDEAGDWTVILTFAAGGRERQARWAFDVKDRTVSAADDEARWLSEEEAPDGGSPLPAPHLVSAPVRSTTTVYDVEAEGGVGSARRAPRSPNAAPPVTDEPLDLMSAMRERASHRGRPRRRKSAPTQTPLDEAPRDDALPLEDLAFDPETMPLPPAARGTHPLDDERAADADAGVEPAAEAAAPQVDQPVGDDVLPAREESADAPPDDAEAEAEAEAEVTVEAEVEVDSEAANATVDPEPAEPAQPAQPARPPKKPGRRSVPSWDDVMFGAKPKE